METRKLIILWYSAWLHTDYQLCTLLTIFTTRIHVLFLHAFNNLLMFFTFLRSTLKVHVVAHNQSMASRALPSIGVLVRNPQICKEMMADLWFLKDIVFVSSGLEQPRMGSAAIDQIITRIGIGCAKSFSMQHCKHWPRRKALQPNRFCLEISPINCFVPSHMQAQGDRMTPQMQRNIRDNKIGHGSYLLSVPE